MQIDPTDYKVNGTKSKQRVYGGKFGNALDQVPWVNFDEQMVTYDAIADRVFANEAGSCMVTLSDPAKPLTLRNPTDDSIIPVEMFIGKLTAQGGVAYEDMFIFMYSLGRQTQIERDEVLLASRIEGA